MQILTIIKNVGIFIICAQAIIHFKPAQNYEKYLKLLTNTMVLAMIFIPVVSFVRKDGYTIYMEKLREYERMLQQDMPKIKLEDSWGEERILMLTKQELQTRFNEIAGECGYQVLSVTWEKSDMTGKVIVAVVENPEENAREISPIEDIKVELSGQKDEKDMENADKENKLQLLSNAFALVLGMEQSNVEVVVGG